MIERTGARVGGALTLVGAMAAAAVVWAAAPRAPADPWARHRASMLRTPGLVRYYTFESPLVAQTPVRNLAGAAGALAYGVVATAGAPEEPSDLVPGRWPAAAAVRLDRGVLTAEPFDVRARAFSAEAWVRPHGHGTLRGNGGSTNGTLLSQGNGYWDGWRVTLAYPDRTLGFEIGRPQPASSFGFFGVGPLTDGAWHHIVATWDGRAMRLYLDGGLAGSAPYAGAYTPPAPGDRFRIGYADAGWGSVKMDVDEVALYDRALSSVDVLERFHYRTPMPALMRASLEAGEAAYARRDFAAAGAAFRTAARLRGAPPGLRDHALLRLRAVGAAALQARRERGDAAAARALAVQMLQDGALPAAQRQDLRMQVAHADRGAGRFAVARRNYLMVAESAGGRTPLHWYARLLAAHCLSLSRDLRGAGGEYRKLLVQSDLPSSFRLEAADALGEVERMSAGKPARDPSGSRVRLPATPRAARELFVSPTGSDRSPGTRGRPLATFAGAVRAVRAIRARGPLPRGGLAITFGDGEYRVFETVRISAADSGSARSPVVFRAAPGASPRFSGGVRLRGFGPVLDPDVLARLPESARGHVLRLDLRRAVIGDPGRLAPHGVGFAPQPVPELFWNGRALPLARWPNQGWARTGAVVEEKTAEGGFSFRYDGDRPARWAHARDGFLMGYWRWLWADGGLRLAGVDARTGTIRTADTGAYGIQAGMPYYAYNLLEELDVPGEWVLDRDVGALYVYPPSDPRRAAIAFSVFPGAFVEMEGAAHVRLEGLTFELGQGDGLRLRGGNDCLVAGCTVRRIGGTAVAIDGGARHGVFGCDLESLGRGGVAVRGGDRRTLRPGGHFVENCDIHDFSRWDRTYTPAVGVDGVGIRVAHNLISGSPGHALRIEGNDHIIEYNDVHDVVYETDDQGGLDMWGNPTYRGVVIRHNYWHHIGQGVDGRMRAGIRLDDAICGVTIYGNVFYRAADGFFGAVQIHGGKENVVDNNLLVSCRHALSFSPWGADRWQQYLHSPAMVEATTRTVNVGRPPYSTRYPAVSQLAENPDVNSVWRSVVVDCGDFMIRDGGREDLMDNLVLGRQGGSGVRPPALPKAAAGLSGFRPIPIAEIGLYRHPLRATWPVRSPVGTHYRE